MFNSSNSGKLDSYIRRNAFGNIIGVINETNVLGVELSNDQSKIISVISVSFRVPSGETLATKPFLYGGVAVFRGIIRDYPLPLKLKDVENNQNLDFVKFFHSYSGFTENVYIPAGKTEKLSVVLFAPYLQDDPATQAEVFGSLSVFGSFQQEKNLFEVG